MTAHQDAAARAGARPVSPAHVSPAFKSARLMIDRVIADATTKEIDRDEIVLASVEAVGEVTGSGPKAKVSAKARRGGTIDAGQFKKGDVRDFNPARVIAELPLGPRQGDWPRRTRATLLMVEKDEGDIGTIVAAVVDAIDKDLSRQIGSAAAGLAATVATAALAGGAAGSVVPLLGTAVGTAVAAATTAAFGAISQARKDDLFPPETVDLTLAAYPQRPGKVDGSGGTARFQAKGGSYRVTYWWEIA